jgi:hypothetical protein
VAENSDRKASTKHTMGLTLYDSKRSEDTAIETELKTYLQNAYQKGETLASGILAYLIECSPRRPRLSSRHRHSAWRKVIVRHAQIYTIRPGGADLDRQLGALRATVGRSRGLRLDGTIRHIASDAAG